LIQHFKRNIVTKMSQIGPCLPPHLQKRNQIFEEESGPDLTGKKIENNDSSSDSDDYGPALPPHLMNKNLGGGIGSVQKLHGPSLPPGFKLPAAGSNLDASEDDDSDDDDIIGPRLPTQGISAAESAAMDIEERARRMKDRLDGKDCVEEPKRETWMLELPSDKRKSFGLGPRQFSRKGHLGPQKGGDRSAWTDSPAEKERKLREGIDPSRTQNDEPPPDLVAQKRDKKMEKITEEINKKRGTESLMDMHTKKLNKKAKKEKKEGVKQERRAFDRDIDLQANKFDEAQRKAMIKKSAGLGDRYTSGGQKFL